MAIFRYFQHLWNGCFIEFYTYYGIYKLISWLDPLWSSPDVCEVLRSLDTSFSLYSIKTRVLGLINHL